jgi:hypothetical protein
MIAALRYRTAATRPATKLPAPKKKPAPVNPPKAKKTAAANNGKFCSRTREKVESSIPESWLFAGTGIVENKQGRVAELKNQPGPRYFFPRLGRG